MNFCNHSPEDFRALVKKGRGEAILWLREEKYKGFFVPIIKDAVMHDYRYDRQCDESRAEYIYSLIKELYDYEHQIEAICLERHKFNINDIGEDFSHLIEVLSCFSKYGHMMPRRIITEKYTELFTSLMNRSEDPDQILDTECENFVYAILGAVNGDALSPKDAVCDIGRLITENPLFNMVRFDYTMYELKRDYSKFAELSSSEDEYIQKALSEYSIIEEAHKKESLRYAELKESFKQFENINRTIEVIREGKFLADRNGSAIRAALKQTKLEVSQIKELWDIALQTNDVNIKLLIYPLISSQMIINPLITSQINIKDLITEAKRYNHILLDPEKTEKWDRECILAYSLNNMLGQRYSGEDEIRSYARELEERGMPLRYRLRLETHILSNDNTDAFFAYIDKIEKNEEESEHLLHDIFFTVIKIWETRDDVAPKPELLWGIYDKVICSGCRLNAVRLMEKYHCLPDSIKEAAVYDCVGEIREIAKRYK